MHYKIVAYILGKVLTIESALLILPTIVGLIYREEQWLSFLIMVVVCFLVGMALSFKKPEKFVFYAREGIVSVALSWIFISIFGAMPFVINGDIPYFPNALFETISGFTTTGASILSDVEALSHASLFWRSFIHWIGGMGVIVFMLAIIPMTGGYNAQLMRAESPGPSFGKLVPKLKESAKLLYMLYVGLTGIELVLLLAARMPVFDALCLTFGTAGTGGFGVLNSSIADYSILQQGIITIFMILFGVNFNAYYFLTGRNKKEVFKMEEVRWYFIIIIVSITLITIDVRKLFDSTFLAIHHVAFQIGSIITTTGYSTVDFDTWPTFSKGLLLLLMFLGACAGSTGGGFKVSRLLILVKSVKQQFKTFLHPKSVSTIKFDGKQLDKQTSASVSTYLATYVFIFIISMLLLTIDPNWDLLTDFTAVAATINNIGPGLNGVGPSCNYDGLSLLSKFVLMFDMLAGRLELYPMLLLFVPTVWKRNCH